MNILILAAAAAIAGPPASGAATLQPVAAKPANDFLVCRQEAVLGSRMPVKVCESRATRANAEGRARQARQAIERVQDGGFAGRAHIN